MTNKLLITGITGQVGSQLADFVLDNTSFNIVGMMRWQEPMDNLYHLTDRINQKDRIELYYADLNDYSALSRMVKIFKTKLYITFSSTVLSENFFQYSNRDIANKHYWYSKFIRSNTSRKRVQWL